MINFVTQPGHGEVENVIAHVIHGVKDNEINP